MTIDATTYPEHAKLDEVKHLSQAIYDFLEWCEKGKIFLAVPYEPHPDFYIPCVTSTRDLLAEHFEIDQARLEAEKRAMLDVLRADNDKEIRP